MYFIDAPDTDVRQSPYHGVRMTAAQFFALPDDGFWYELVDGVVVMSPSPTPGHQRVCGLIYFLLQEYLFKNPIGEAFYETDVYLGRNIDARDIVYRPEVVYLSRERFPRVGDRIRGVPDVVVEVISPQSRRMDTITKRKDYERFGVQEYWLVDPIREEMRFLRRRGRKLLPVAVRGKYFASQAVAGFRLDLDRVRRAFREP
jgi:Uma2 family endonuclease